MSNATSGFLERNDDEKPQIYNRLCQKLKICLSLDTFRVDRDCPECLGTDIRSPDSRQTATQHI